MALICKPQQLRITIHEAWEQDEKIHRLNQGIMRDIAALIPVVKSLAVLLNNLGILSLALEKKITKENLISHAVTWAKLL